MSGAGWCRQLSANLQRNLLLKWRKKWDIAKVTNAKTQKIKIENVHLQPLSLCIMYLNI